MTEDVLTILHEVDRKVDDIRWKDYHRRKKYIWKSIERRERKASKRKMREYDYDWYDW